MAAFLLHQARTRSLLHPRACLQHTISFTISTHGSTCVLSTFLDCVAIQSTRFWIAENMTQACVRVGVQEKSDRKIAASCVPCDACRGAVRAMHFACTARWLSLEVIDFPNSRVHSPYFVLHPLVTTEYLLQFMFSSSRQSTCSVAVPCGRSINYRETSACCHEHGTCKLWRRAVGG